MFWRVVRETQLNGENISKPSQLDAEDEREGRWAKKKRKTKKKRKEWRKKNKIEEKEKEIKR